MDKEAIQSLIMRLEAQSKRTNASLRSAIIEGSSRSQLGFFAGKLHILEHVIAELNKEISKGE